MTTKGREELVELCRRRRVLEMEVEILKWASAYFARRQGQGRIACTLFP